MSSRSAVETALDLYRHPIKVNAARKSTLPNDILALIRIVAGSDDEVAALDLPDVKSPSEMREAAAFYMQQVMFQKDNDSHRILGLNSKSTPQQIKDHKRLLLKWLHPDRNHNKWERVYFQRVLHAAEKLEGNPTKALVLFETPNKLKAKQSGENAKLKLRMKPNHASLDLRTRLRIWLKRGLVFSLVFIITICLFSAANRMGYLSDDLPILEQLQAWLI
jgi:hypothetical protein